MGGGWDIHSGTRVNMYMPEQSGVWKIELSAEDQVSVFSSGLHKLNSAARI